MPAEVRGGAGDEQVSLLFGDFVQQIGGAGYSLFAGDSSRTGLP
jgi:hypothetical protein